VNDELQQLSSSLAKSVPLNFFSRSNDLVDVGREVLGAAMRGESFEG